MLQDYRNYIVNIRNGLIQCGVEVSISPLSSYRELFYEADKLSQILWFYSIMGISDSPLALDGFLINLTGYYKEKMRQKFFSEFQDYYESYKNISTLASLAGEDKDDALVEDAEEFDLFGEMSEDSEQSIADEVSQEESSNEVAEEVHGTYLDEENIYSNIDKVLGTGYIPASIGVDLSVQEDESLDVHGVFLEDVGMASDLEEFELPEVSDEDIHGVMLDEVSESEESSDEDIHGTYLDDVIVEDRVSEDYSENYDEEEPYDDIHYSDDEDEVYDEEEPYDDIHYPEDNEDEGYVEDEDNSYNDIHYSDDDEEDEGYDEEDDSYNDIHYSDDDEEEDVQVEEPKVSKPSVAMNVKPVVAKGDMSDALQDGVNAILTKGKRFIMNESRKLRDAEQN